jgi:hypothetical protein
MTYEIEVAAQPRRTIASVAWTTTWEQFPHQWRGMLDEVYAWLRRAGEHGGCNVMLYRDLPGHHQIDVEVGVEVTGPFSPFGRVRPSALPAGLAVTPSAAGALARAGNSPVNGGRSTATGRTTPPGWRPGSSTA